MHLATQLAVFLENRPGTLAEMGRVLAKAGINIIAMTTSDTVDHTVVRIVVSEPKKATRIFEERGVLVIDTEVIQIEGDNRPGSLSVIADRLSKSKINIEYLYFATLPDSKRGMVIIRCGDAKRALRVLNRRK